MKFILKCWFTISAVAYLTSNDVLNAQVFDEIYSFEVFGTNGDSPHGGLIQATDGNFYGTTFYGGKWDWGAIFRMTPDGAVTALASLNGTTTDQHPISTLVEATDGNFYGATDGAVFRVTPAGSISLFGCGSTSGTGDLMQASNGYLYGASAYYAAIFWMPLAGSPCDDVLVTGRPSSSLIQARDGRLYGLTSDGGIYGDGSVYRMTTNGQLTTFSSFNRTNAATDYARSPYGRLLEASDGSFYGVAAGGYYDGGCIFRLTTNGVLTTMASFRGFDGLQPNGGLIEANDGNFYGTCRYGGATGANKWVGTVFRVTPAGVITPLVKFTAGEGPFFGANPRAGLVQGTDGNLYGTTSVQGSRGAGNVFRIVMPGPQLNVSRAAGQFIVSWRTNYTGFVLQSSSGLSTSNWLDCTNAPAVSGGQFWMTNPISSGSQFFRLRK